MKKYTLISHTADIGIKLSANSLEELFKKTALAMFDIIAEKKKKSDTAEIEIPIGQQAETLDELLVNWLNELLYLSQVKEVIFTDFSFKKFDEYSLQAIAVAKDMKNYQLNVEIKAATYHELKIEKKASKWQTQIIFDV